MPVNEKYNGKLHFVADERIEHVTELFVEAIGSYPAIWRVVKVNFLRVYIGEIVVWPYTREYDI